MSGILLFSGGVDSTVVLANLVQRGEIPYCLCFDYGQKCRAELRAVYQLLGWYSDDRVKGKVQELPPELFIGSAITGEKELPKDIHYRDQAHEATYVPGRNLIFIAFAVAEAQRRGLNKVYCGSHAPPGSVYKDATTSFCAAANQAATIGYGVEVIAPLAGMNKTEIVTLARKLEVPIELTWSCYEAGDVPCGRCGQCLHRTEALQSPAEPTP